MLDLFMLEDEWFGVSKMFQFLYCHYIFFWNWMQIFSIGIIVSENIFGNIFYNDFERTILYCRIFDCSFKVCELLLQGIFASGILST